MTQDQISDQDVRNDGFAVKGINAPNQTSTAMKMETGNVDPSKNPSFCRQLFSWRALILILLQLSIVTIGLPRTTFNMAFVCSTDRRLGAIKTINWSAASLPVVDHQYGTNGQLLTNSSRGLDIVDPADGQYHQSVRRFL